MGGSFVLWNLFYVNFCWCVTNIADVIQIADISEDFCEPHGIFGEIIALCVCVNIAHANMYRETSRDVYIVSGKPARYIHIWVFIALFEFKFKILASTFEVRECDDMWTSTRLRYRFQVQLAFKTMTELSKQYLNSKTSTQCRTCYNVV